jgi:hypothetical protein
LHLATIPPWTLAGYCVGGGLLAIWKGGWLERAVGATVVVEILTQSDTFLGWRGPAWYPALWDLVILATCVTCALRSDRYWTIAASSFALLECVTDLGRFVPSIGDWALRSGLWTWNILLVSSLLAGVGSAIEARAPRARPLR